MANKNKVYYEIVRGYDDSDGKEFIALYGPMSGIRRARGNDPQASKYKFVQVMNDKVVAAFTKDEILILDEVL